MGVLDFLSKEAGQARRRALDERIAGVLDRVGYYAGPELSEFGRGLLQVGGMLNPIAALEDSSRAGERMFAPDRTPMQRAGDTAEMLSGVAATVAPVVAGRMSGGVVDDAANVMESLLGWSPTKQALIDRANQPGPVPTMYSNPIMKAADDVDQTRIAIHKSSEDFSDIDLTKSADGTFWLASPDADWSNIVTTGKGFEHKFEVSPNAKLATWDDIDRYSVDELEALGFDGVMMDDGGGDVSYQIWNTDVLNRIANPTKPLTEAEQQAQGILDLLTSGRADEVTDEMLAAADDRYLFQHYDLPMDEASRMARAQEMGFDVGASLYHGTTAHDFSEFTPSNGGRLGPGVYFSPDANRASVFAGAAPIDVKLGEPAINRSRVIDALTSASMADDAARSAAGAARREAGLGSDAGRIAFQDALGDFGGVSVADEVTVLDPANIRSRFARFDPRLKHLRNLSAGVGGLGLLSQYDQPQDDLEQQTRQYLGGLL